MVLRCPLDNRTPRTHEGTFLPTVSGTGNTVASMNSAEITTLLKAWRQGDRPALDRLPSLLYDELRSMAHRYTRRERAGHSLQTTGQVSEAFLRLVDVKGIDWQSRALPGGLSAAHAAHPRRGGADARRGETGGDVARLDHSSAVDVDAILPPRRERADELRALDDALQALAAIDSRRARVIELRFFGGLTVEETADVLNVSRQTVLRDWKLARAWLSRELRRQNHRVEERGVLQLVLALLALTPPPPDFEV